MQEQLDRIETKLAEMSGKIDASFASAEKTRKYILWTGLFGVAVIVIPLLLFPIVLPAFLQSLALPAGF